MEQTWIKAILENAEQAAKKAAQEYYTNELGGQDRGACGFGWVVITEYEGKRIKGNTKVGRTLKAVGVNQNWQRLFEVWSPARFPAQNVDVHLAGAQAYAQVLREVGFTAYAQSRLD